jgi:hypothetical protein
MSICMQWLILLLISFVTNLKWNLNINRNRVSLLFYTKWFHSMQVLFIMIFWAMKLVVKKYYLKATLTKDDLSHYSTLILTSILLSSEINVQFLWNSVKNMFVTDKLLSVPTSCVRIIILNARAKWSQMFRKKVSPVSDRQENYPSNNRKCMRKMIYIKEFSQQSRIVWHAI